MKIFGKILIFTVTLLFACAVFVNAQKKAADYKITNVKIIPFDAQKGEFQAEFKQGDERSFFNDLAISLFVTIEISGEAGSFEDGRIIEVTVTEGKKQKARKSEQIGLIGEGGKFYIPL